MSKRAGMWLLIGATISFVIFICLPTYYLRTAASSELFWNSSEAYLFVKMRTDGWRMSYGGLLIERVRETFPFGASPPQTSHYSLRVLRITADGVQRRSFDNFEAGNIEPFRGSLYVGNTMSRGTIMKWSSMEFVSTANEESKAFYANVNNLPAGPDWDDVAGWSKRTVAGTIAESSGSNVTETPATAVINVGNKQLSLRMSSGLVSGEAFVDLSQPDQPPRRVWTLDGHAHRVSRAEYQQAFGSGNN